MGDMGTRRGSGQCATPSVAKNVKYFDFFAVKQFKLIYYPEPIGGLFGENSDMSKSCLLYTSPSPRDQRGSRMPSSA